MFGIRRSNVSYKRNVDSIRNNLISENPKNADLIGEDEEEDIYKSAKFIFYDDKKQFTNQIEIYISLTNYKNKKLLVIISSDSSIEKLNNQIVDSLESFPEFKDINAVRVENIYKISNGSKISLPQEGKASDFINSGDILYCDLITDEFWIKTYFNLQTLNFKKIIKLEYKLKKKMRYKRFKLMLMKGGMQLFIENIKSDKKYTIFSYYLKLFEFKIKKHKKVITHNILNKQKDKTTIDKIINFSSEIIVILKFGVFENLIHKNIKITKAYHRNNLRVNEYNDLTFDELINETKFLPEYNAIKELAEKFLNEQYNSKNPNFLFYTKKKPKKNSINDYFFTKKNKQIFIDDKKTIGEIAEEDDDKEEKVNDNINIDQLYSVRNSSFNSIKNIELDSFDSKANEEKKNMKKKSLFSKTEKYELNNIKIDKKELDDIKTDKQEKKPKKEKIKNMIVIANFLIKEEKKKEKMFTRKISHQYFNNNLEFRKNVPNTKNKKISFSNKNLSIYDNKTNINYLMEEEEEKQKYNNNYKIEESKEEENDSEFIEFASKPKTFSDKNILQNFLFKSTEYNKKNNSNDALDDLFLDFQENDKENTNKYNNYGVYNNSSNNNHNLKKSLINNNGNFNNKVYPIFSEPYDDNASSSNLDDENEDEANNEATKKFVRQSLGRRSTFIHKNKKSLFSNLRNKTKMTNFYQEIKNMFNSDIFLNEIKSLFNNTCDKKSFDKIKMPHTKDIEYLEKEYKLLIEKRKTRKNDELKFGSGVCHIYIFMSLLFIFSAMIIICLNIDLMSLYY